MSGPLPIPGRRIRVLALLLSMLGLLLVALPLAAQTNPPQPVMPPMKPASSPPPPLTGPAPRDAAGVALAQQALAALAPAGAPAALELDGTATWIAGSTRESGSARLVAQGPNNSRVELTLSQGQRIETHSGTPDRPQGQYQGEDSVGHAFALHNNFVPAAWFAPLLSPLGELADPAVGVSYIGAETHNGAACEHVRFYRIVNDPRLLIQQQFEKLSQSDLYLDAATFLPVALDFTVHPDNNERIDLPVEIRYAGYAPSNGGVFPSSIQRYVNGTLVLDLQVTATNPQPEVGASVFTLTVAGGGQ